MSADATKMTGQKLARKDDTACFVHQLIEKDQRARESNALNDFNRIKEDQLPHDGGDQQLGATHSRLLTKKQLSDMAWGVRELSKRLATLRLKLKVRVVFLLTKAHDEDLISNTRGVAEWLLSKDRVTPYIVYVEETLKDNHRFDAKGLVAQEPSSEGRLKYWTNELCRKHPNTFDFIITLGGDGTVLYASWLFQRVVPPVLSFAMGSLGFLTKFDYDNFEDTLATAFKDGVTVALRLRFEGTVMRANARDAASDRDLVQELIGEEADNDHTHKPDGSYEILNDIVVDRGPNPSKCRCYCLLTRYLHGQQCLQSKYSAMMSISLPSKPMAYALLPLQAQPRIIWQLEALCAIRRIQSY